MSQSPPSSSPPRTRTRNEAAEDISRALRRFPLLVRILGEMQVSTIPHPGDDDIRHGCDRALTAMLSALAHIEPAPAGDPHKQEATLRAPLNSPAAVALVDADKLQRIQMFVDRVLGADGHA